MAEFLSLSRANGEPDAVADAGPFFLAEQQQADASSNRGSDREPVEIALAEPDCEPEHKTNREPDRLAHVPPDREPKLN